MIKQKEIRCKCGALLCERSKLGNLEFEIKGRKVFFAFPWAITQCRECERIWFLQPFRLPEQLNHKEYDLVNLKVDYLENKNIENFA